MNKLLLSTISLIALTANYANATSCPKSECGPPSPPPPAPGAPAALAADYSAIIAKGIAAKLLPSNFASTVTTDYLTASVTGTVSYAPAAGSSKAILKFGSGIGSASAANAYIAHAIGVAESQSLETAAATATKTYGVFSKQAIAAVNAAEAAADAFAAKLMGVQNYVNGLSAIAATEITESKASGVGRTDANSLFARVKTLAQANPGVTISVAANLIPGDTGTMALNLNYTNATTVNTSVTTSTVTSAITASTTAIATETTEGDTLDAEFNQGQDLLGVGAGGQISDSTANAIYATVVSTYQSLGLLSSNPNLQLYISNASMNIPGQCPGVIEAADVEYANTKYGLGLPEDGKNILYLPTGGMTDDEADALMYHEVAHGVQMQNGSMAAADAAWEACPNQACADAVKSASEEQADLIGVETMADNTLGGLAFAAQDYVDALASVYQNAGLDGSFDDASHGGFFDQRIDMLSQNLALASSDGMAPELLIPSALVEGGTPNGTPLVMDSIVVNGNVENDIAVETPEMQELIPEVQSQEAAAIAAGNPDAVPSDGPPDSEDAPPGEGDGDGADKGDGDGDGDGMSGGDGGAVGGGCEGFCGDGTFHY